MTTAVEGRPVRPADEPPETVAAPPAAPPSAAAGSPPGVPEQHRFPVATLDEGLTHLRRPFTREAVKWKIQNVFRDASGCQIVAYIDARLVDERLNYVVGGHWEEDFEPLPDGLMVCRLKVFDQTHTDVGSGYRGKGLYSDALKRAAVKFGVGNFLYALPEIKWWAKEAVELGLLERIEVQRKPSLRLTPEGHASLRQSYDNWLEKVGVRMFGDPIDHGDVENSAGEEPEAEASAGEVNDLPTVQVPLVDAEADGLRIHCRLLYENIDGRKLPKARFENELRQASVSHAELEAFAEKLGEMVK